MVAWRNISKKRFLVFLEAEWSKTYVKAAKSHKGIDTSFFQRKNWEQELQKTLCEHQLIKQTGFGYRYRYDLFKNGTRDSTYVLAIPAHLFES